jgi:transposase
MSDLVGIDKDKIISGLIIRLERLEARVLELERENAELRDRLRGYENPKNSRNSSIPPSRDVNRPKKNRSLRKATGRKPGGQPGNKGNTLKMNPDPDHVVELRPEYCRACGSAMGYLPSTMERVRQTVDVPPVRAVWTEYRTYGRQCGCAAGRWPTSPRAWARR